MAASTSPAAEAGPRTTVGSLQVAEVFRDFVERRLLPGSGYSAEHFWSVLEDLLARFTDENARLLAERVRLQRALDDWYRTAPTAHRDPVEHERFLRGIGYLVPEPADVRVSTGPLDPEVASVAGPQLVVPVLNARFVLNAANARWGSVYDALYGTDALTDDPAPAGGYDPARGAQVVAAVRSFLDEVVPLAGLAHAAVTSYAVRGEQLCATGPAGELLGLREPRQFAGYTGSPEAPDSVLLRNHGLHIELRVDRSGTVGATDPAGVQDVVLESALTAIVDLEDSVAAVDAEDKVDAYANWLALNRGDLRADLVKDGRQLHRRLATARTYLDPGGRAFSLPGRALLLVRNVGLHMTTDAVLDGAGRAVPEGIVDALVTVVAALPGLDPESPGRNSRHGSVYVVKPKLHGPAEAAFAARVFEAVEVALGLAPSTVKIGLMDEERRTTLNLTACVAELADRLFFINTGFLDRSGDEISTSSVAGPMVRKADMRAQRWIAAYERHNVDVGLEVGLHGRGQIGKGMWAKPDRMAEMLRDKVAQLTDGASTAWVPSPTAATLHAMHYHRVDVATRQDELRARPRAALADLVALPLGDRAEWDDAAVAEELDDNVQSILGYVVRWVDLGIGCSKVADLRGVGLMEDRATLRISSQLLANWLRHGVVSQEQVHASLARMAVVVDAQNAGVPGYRPMAAGDGGSASLLAATELILSGSEQPNGYTEATLHRWRRIAKAGSTAAPTESAG